MRTGELEEKEWDFTVWNGTSQFGMGLHSLHGHSMFHELPHTGI